jgi:putative endonuclease
MADNRQQRGAVGEEVATAELERAGYRVVERNYRCRVGEIDVIAFHDETLCFVEVRTRRQGAMVDGFSSVDSRKRRKVVRAAQTYCHARNVGQRPMRFDVVQVEALAQGGYSTEIIRNAFDATGRP